MARMSEMPEGLAKLLKGLECQAPPTASFVTGKPLTARRVAIISTAGLQRRGEKPFSLGASDYRVIPSDLPASDLVMSHVSSNFDRNGFQEDVNVVFPIERLRELANEGVIGSVAEFHYSFMGATDPNDMAETVDQLAPILKNDGVDAVLLAPV
ncbi:MAG: glycine/sarcosine/betaine reductase selenoprotein B family protein [Pseudomonadota bacterium]